MVDWARNDNADTLRTNHPHSSKASADRIEARCSPDVSIAKLAGDGGGNNRYPHIQGVYQDSETCNCGMTYPSNPLQKFINRRKKFRAFAFAAKIFGRVANIRARTPQQFKCAE